VEGMSLDLDNSQKETRNSSSELFRIKNAYEESVLQLEEVRNFFNVSSFKKFQINTNPGSYLKRTRPCGIQFISTSIFEERGCREWKHMCRFISMKYSNMVCALISDATFNVYFK
jgi:hypothetical protein